MGCFQVPFIISFGAVTPSQVTCKHAAQTCIHAYTCRHADMQTCRHADMQTCRHADISNCDAKQHTCLSCQLLFTTHGTLLKHLSPHSSLSSAPHHLLHRALSISHGPLQAPFTKDLSHHQPLHQALHHSTQQPPPEAPFAFTTPGTGTALSALSLTIALSHGGAMASPTGPSS